MKKTKKPKKPKSKSPHPREVVIPVSKEVEQGLYFLEDFRKLMGEKDEPTVPISLRLPANILRMLKYKARTQNKKYQSLIVEYLRKGLKEG